MSVVQNCDLHTAYLVLECGAYTESTSLRNPADDHVELALRFIVADVEANPCRPVGYGCLELGDSRELLTKG